jgi:serine/threonine-protein kinase RsbW
MGPLSAARPPGDRVQVAQWSLGSFAELRLLRAALRQTLREQPMPDGHVLDNLPERMAIVATELAANAMAHARPPTTVRLFRTEMTVILDVADNDPWVVPHLTDDRLLRARGLGLHMARQLALEIGWYVDGGTKHVWAQVAIPAARRDDDT